MMAAALLVSPEQYKETGGYLQGGNQVVFDEAEFQSRTEQAVENMRDRLEEVLDASDSGDYRECARLWSLMSTASVFLASGSREAAKEKAETN